MPGWNEINSAIDEKIATGLQPGTACDSVRQDYIAVLSGLTGRCTICYYSGWLQGNQSAGRSHPEIIITDQDVNGFMTAVRKLPTKTGLDLILHTPGGNIAATAAIVDYLHKIFNYDIRVIIPQAAFSAGTMIACAAREIIMGKQSSLGPTDPQIDGMPAIGALEEIDAALEEIKQEPQREIFWRYVFSQYPLTFVTECRRAKKQSEKLVEGWLQQVMFKDKKNAEKRAKKCVKHLTDFGNVIGHGHHFSTDNCRQFGLVIRNLEKNQKVQDAVLSIHHAYMATFSRVAALKIIESSNGQRWAMNYS